MRSAPSLVVLAFTTFTGFAFVASIFLAPDLAFAGEAGRQQASGELRAPKSPKPAAPGNTTGNGGSAPSCTCPGSRERLWSRPKFAELRAELDEADEIAALESVQVALSEVGDGASYVWHRHNGRLSGVVQPTASFKDGSGNVCRHVVVLLSSGADSRKAEGVACRLADGRWLLEG